MLVLSTVPKFPVGPKTDFRDIKVYNGVYQTQIKTGLTCNKVRFRILRTSYRNREKGERHR